MAGFDLISNQNNFYNPDKTFSNSLSGSKLSQNSDKICINIAFSCVIHFLNNADAFFTQIQNGMRQPVSERNVLLAFTGKLPGMHFLCSQMNNSCSFDHGAFSVGNCAV